MIKITYLVKPEEAAAELEWLREQKVYPSSQPTFDWVTLAPMVQFGMIVSQEAALTIKLRRQIDGQSDYNQR
jgi:hypothetical protein